MTDPSQRILVVGDDDVCTAPYVAAVLRAELRGLDDLQVSSAGLDGAVGQPACDTAVIRAPGGTDFRHHRSVPANAERIRDADLVITMNVDQRALVNRLAPGSQTWVFTLREAAAIARVFGEAAGYGTLGEAAGYLHRHRGLVTPKRIPVPRRGLLRRPILELTVDDLPEAHALEASAHVWALAQARAAALGLALALRPLRRAAASAA